jgi:hypothetical protein
VRHLFFCLTLFAVLFCAAPAFAQSEPPPPPAPDYFPDRWKEYVYEQDDVKFRFPVEPKVTATTTNESFGTVTRRTYSRESFIQMSLQVATFPAAANFEKGEATKGLLKQMRDAGLNEVKATNPRIIKESDITVDGHPGKFMHLESDDGKTVRIKFFVVRNRLYFSFTEAKTGPKHGLNFDNDFEKVTMTFLDSIRLVSADK